MGDLCWKNAIVHHLDVQTFADSLPCPIEPDANDDASDLVPHEYLVVCVR